MLRRLLCLLVLLLPSPVLAQGFAPGEHVLMPLPDGFVLGNRAEDDTGMLAEYLPEGEGIEAWSQLVTLRVFRQLGGADPVAFHSRMAQALEAACPNSVNQEVTSGIEAGTPFHLVLGGCHNSPVTGGEEWFLSKVMAGQDALYLVQGAWRGPVTDEQLVFWSQFLSSVTICDTRRDDAPCPG